MRHIKFCCRVILGYDENKTNEILHYIRNIDEPLCAMEKRYLCNHGFPVIREGIKTKTQLKKFCFEWERETRLAFDKMKLREILIKELDESKSE